jgi:hypothetical protein
MRLRVVTVIGAVLAVAGLATTSYAAPIVTVTILSTSHSAATSGPTSVACMSEGSCVLSGYGSNNHAYVRTEKNGHWGPSRDPTMNLGKIVNSTLVAMSCYKGGCLGFGRFIRSARSTGNSHFTFTYARGKLQKATALTLKLGAAKSFQEFRISCSNSHNCVVVGALGYSSAFSSDPIYAPAILTMKDGKWGSPQPLGKRSSGKGRVVEFLDVSCPTWGNCVAVGIGTINGIYGSLDAIEVKGRWAPAKSVFPARWTVLSVSCRTTSDCTAGGRIATTHGSAAFVSTEQGGHWITPVPVGTIWTVNGESESSANYLSCQSATTCVVAGNVDGPRPTLSGKVSVSSVAWIASESKGKWSEGTLIGYKRGAINSGQAVGLSCPSSGSCVVVGQFSIKDSSMSLIGSVHSFVGRFAA